MKNRRLFARIPCNLPTRAHTGGKQLNSRLFNISLGGIGLETATPLQQGQKIQLYPDVAGDFQPVTYEVRWSESQGSRFRNGLRFPERLPEFWESWAANVLAGIDITNGEVMERRRLVRVPCHLGGKLTRGPESHLGTLLNLGVGGALLYCRPQLPHGAMFQLNINSPAKVEELECRVLRSWSRHDSWLYGVEFVGLNDQGRAQLATLLERLLT